MTKMYVRILCKMYVRILYVIKKGDFMSKSAQSHIKYAKKNLKRIPLDLQLEMFEKWKKYADSMHIPLNTMIKNAVNEKINLFDKND